VYCQDPGYPLLKKLIGEGLAKVAFSESLLEYLFPPFLWRSSELFFVAFTYTGFGEGVSV
jgi:hypothetical protein